LEEEVKAETKSETTF